MNETFERLAKHKIVPVVTINDVEAAVPLAQQLLADGYACMEITFRTGAAVASVRAIVQAFPQLLVGAGTVLTTAQADEAAAAGASFMVAPGLREEVVRHCQQMGVPMIPGVMTPGDIERGLALGLTHMKFFPAQAAGGVAMLRALAAPYGMVRFMPTGGINPGNVADYLALPCVFACGGSWMTKEH